VLGALAVLVAVGAWEREHRADQESAGMRAVLDDVGSLDSEGLRGFRIFVNFQCLVYKQGRNDFALELCIDDQGRVVEAIDRRDGTAEVWSLRDDRSRSNVVVDRAEVNRLLRRMNVPDRYLPDV
jgi:hypothetical protein